MSFQAMSVAPAAAQPCGEGRLAPGFETQKRRFYPPAEVVTLSAQVIKKRRKRQPPQGTTPEHLSGIKPADVQRVERQQRQKRQDIQTHRESVKNGDVSGGIPFCAIDTARAQP